MAGALWEAARRSDARREEKEGKGLVKPRDEAGGDSDLQKFERAWVETGIAGVTKEGMCPVVLRRGRGHRRKG